MLMYDDPKGVLTARRTALNDYAMFQRLARWAEETYGKDSPRMRQARAELAMAALAVCQARGLTYLRVRTFAERAMTIDELCVIAKPALDADYGLPPPKPPAKKKPADKKRK